MGKLPGLLGLVALAALAAAACGSPCQDLADRICNCQPQGSLRDSCTSSVKNQLGSYSQLPGNADENRCQELLKTCPDPASNPDQCQVLQTPAGKAACGLAYAPDGGI